MEIAEITLLILAYTVGIITLFIEWVCYARKIETLETIFFTTALLLLIIALTIINLFDPDTYFAESRLFLLFAMILVAGTTLLNVLAERQHMLGSSFKYLVWGISGLMLIVGISGYLFEFQIVAEYIGVAFLIGSIIVSMVLILTTAPQFRIQHREKIERITAIACLVILPLTLGYEYLADLNGYTGRIGFTYSAFFLLMSGSKLWDDLRRLALFKPVNNINTLNLTHYNFTTREKEIIDLLITGATYKQMAETLFIALPTVKSHVSNIYKKAGVRNKIELIALLSN